MNHHRPDLGPQLRRLLAQQPVMHDIPPTPTNSGVEMRLALLAAQDRRSLIWQAYGGTHPSDRRAGGTRKVADLPRVCASAAHNPPSMMVYEPGIWEHTCPACGARQSFTVTRPVWR